MHCTRFFGLDTTFVRRTSEQSPGTVKESRVVLGVGEQWTEAEL
jgi:hypothetical protein